MAGAGHIFGGGVILFLTMYDSDHLIGIAPLFRWGTTAPTISFSRSNDAFASSIVIVNGGLTRSTFPASAPRR